MRTHTREGLRQIVRATRTITPEPTIEQYKRRQVQLWAEAIMSAFTAKVEGSKA